MKRKSVPFFQIIFICTCALLLISSCKKSGDDNGSFTWTYKSVEYSATYFYILSNQDASGNFLAGLGGSYPPKFGMTGKVLPLETGTHIISPRNMDANWIYFTDNDYQRGECVGTVTITSVAGNRLSGNFALTVKFFNGQTEVLTGLIKNVPITR